MADKKKSEQGKEDAVFEDVSAEAVDALKDTAADALSVDAQDETAAPDSDAPPPGEDALLDEAPEPSEGDPLNDDDRTDLADDILYEEPSPDDTVHDAPEPEPAASASEPERSERVVERVIEQRGSLMPVVVGSLMAALVGFFLARSDILDAALPASMKRPDASAELATLRTALDGQETAVSGLSDTVGALQSSVDAISEPDLAPLEDRIAALSARIDPFSETARGLEDQLAAMTERLAALDARLGDVEKRPITDSVSQEAIAAYERELAALQGTMAAQRAEVEKLIADAQAMEAAAREMEANAKSAARDAANRATAALLRAAVDDGNGFADLAAQLTSAGIVVPPNLAAVAADGVVALAALQDGFPATARAALSEARAAAEGSDSLTSFLQRQLGARSVQPREGDDPDAVLSRAEAALNQGDLALVLDELSALPEPAKAVLADWSALARARLSALESADSLIQSLNTN